MNKELAEWKSMCYGLTEALRDRNVEIARKDVIIQEQLKMIMDMLLVVEDDEPEPLMDGTLVIADEEEEMPTEEEQEEPTVGVENTANSSCFVLQQQMPVMKFGDKFWDPERNLLDQCRLRVIEQHIEAAWEAHQQELAAR